MSVTSIRARETDPKALPASLRQRYGAQFPCGIPRQCRDGQHGPLKYSLSARSRISAAIIDVVKHPGNIKELSVRWVFSLVIGCHFSLTIRVLPAAVAGK
jgi:hypothetical protein